MKYILLICIILCGCETSRVTTEATQATKEVARQELILTGEVAGMPVNLTAKAKSDTITQTKTDTKEVTEVPVEASMGWLSNLLMILLGGGAGGFAIKQLKDGMIKRMSDGIQSFLDEDKKTGESLKTHLSRKMNDTDKKKIKQLKG